MGRGRGVRSLVWGPCSRAEAPRAPCLEGCGCQARLFWGGGARPHTRAVLEEGTPTQGLFWRRARPHKRAVLEEGTPTQGLFWRRACPHKRAVLEEGRARPHKRAALTQSSGGAPPWPLHALAPSGALQLWHASLAACHSCSPRTHRHALPPACTPAPSRAGTTITSVINCPRKAWLQELVGGGGANDKALQVRGGAPAPLCPGPALLPPHGSKQVCVCLCA